MGLLAEVLQQNESVLKRFELFFALDNFGRQLIAFSLELFSFLSGFDDVVGLRVLFSFSIGPVVLLYQCLIFDLQVFDLIVSFRQLHGDLVPFLFGCFLLGEKHILVNLDFLLALLHGHLELVLLVLERVNVVGGARQGLSNFLDLELHDIVLHKNFLFLAADLRQVLVGHIVLKRQLLNHRSVLLFDGFFFVQSAFH